METRLAAVTLEQWVDALQASGRYSFLRAQAIEDSGLSREGVKKALQRLVRRGRVVKLKDYFYVIVPLEYARAGAPPVSWFVKDLMAAMGRCYYVGLLSAAALHGSSHQQPQEFQVVVDRQVRAMKAGRSRLGFFTSKYVARAAVTDMKTPTGMMRVSTPETTVVDLVRFARSAGGLDHVAAVIGGLVSSLDPKRLLAAVRLVCDVPNIQRLGYMLDQMGQRRLSDPLHAWLGRRGHRAVTLHPGRRPGATTENRRWDVRVDRPLEVEA